MEPITIGLLGTALMLILLVLGMPIAFAAALAGFLGLFMLRGWGVAAEVMGFLPHPIATKYVLTVLPMFILMGYFAFHAGLTRQVYWAARQWVGHLPGGLAIATVFGNAGFAACSGASTASAAVFARVALPEMRGYGYDRKLAAGVVAASGTLAALIPPSALIVIYAVIVEQSIGALLIAGIIPGIFSALIYALMLYFRIRFNPTLGPALPQASLRERLISLKAVWGILMIFVMVVGGLYFGVFTPTEAGAAGAFSAFILALASRGLTWLNLKESLMDTARTTAMIFLLIIGVLIFIRLLALSGVTDAFIKFMLGLPLPRLGILMCILFVYVILGMFMDAIGMMLLTLPLFFPIVVGLGYDPIWFGIIVIKCCEICLITPPVGLNVYVVRGVASDIPIEDIFRGIIPFFLMDILTVGLLIAFPQIVTFLPNTMIAR
ncbi:MAG: TRAP transporter large permease [Thermodesulfobacteriota bacterium]|nr:TRAP transporter large permease [Thermodesulfobacteriota bacterium]